jgi:capsular exopolysaccharide synthesis family protein
MEPQGMDQPPDLRSLLRSLWRRKWLFLAILVSLPAAVYVISNLVTKTYEASALVRLEAVRTDVASLQTATVTDIDTEALLLNTEKVAETAATELEGRASAAEIGAAVRTEPLTTDAGSATDLLYVVGEADESQLAADYANAYARAIDTVRTEKALKQLNTSIESVEAQLRNTNDPVTRAEFDRNLQLLRAARTSAADDTEVVQAASPPSTPVSPHPRRNTALAALVALLIALGAVALAERLDRRFRDSSDLEPLLGAPLLSVIPRAAFPGERPAPGPVRESFRTLAASLLYFNVEQPISIVTVASPTKGDGKTTVAVHLAVALARDGKRAILVDCDLRHPQVAVRLGIEPPAGVVEVITQRADLMNALVDIDVGYGRLQVLAAGPPPPNPARLLGSQRMGSLLEELSQLADIVIVDTPPILNVSDAVPLLEKVSGTVVVAQVGETPRDAIERVRQVIDTARGNILGGVATGSAGAGLYGYGAEYYGEEADVDIEPPLPESAPEAPPRTAPVTKAVERESLDADTTPEPSPNMAEQVAPESRPLFMEPIEPWPPREEPVEDPLQTGGLRRLKPVPPMPSGPSPDNGQHGVAEQPESDAVEPSAPEPAAVVDEPPQEWEGAAEGDEYDGWGEPEPWMGEPEEWETTDE